MLALFAWTMLLSASLLFVVQPMAAKMLLPSLGGSSAVWTTCMLFFQLLLLAGYAYAHAGARWLSTKRQAGLHILLMGLAVIVLPIDIQPRLLDPDTSPIAWLLLELLSKVGLPFFVISASAPLLQHWFARTNHRDAEDPYHLYGASNLGSMVALLGYPAFVEPGLGIQSQSMTWAVGFVLLGASTGACIWAMAKNPARSGSPSKAVVAPGEEDAVRTGRPLNSGVTAGRRLRWIFWGFIPSSLMMGTTQYLTTDIASAPLFWVVPLALYLLTFIVVFAKRRFRLPRLARAVLGPAILVVMGISLLGLPMWGVIAAHLFLFFALSLVFHGQLADDRPHVDSLTEFFLLMSVGGALGGLFNGMLAPLIFDRVVEYWLVLMIACSLLPISIFPPSRGIDEDFAPDRNRYLIAPLIIGIGGFLFWTVGFLKWTDGATMALSGAILLAAAALVYAKSRHASLVFAIVLGIASWHLAGTRGAVTNERSFFGAYKVFDRKYGDFHLRKFSHGTTAHGAQGLAPEDQKTPIAYHHPSGPVGQVLDQIPHRRVAVVGLGAGAMAAFAREGDLFDFYEIDPLVEDIAREHFTYLEDCGTNCEVFVGDGRLLVGAQPDQTYDIIFLDAYNSDSVPTHLLTREALQLYLSKLKPEGVIVFHVSNRFLDVRGVVGALAADAGLTVRTQTHTPTKELRRRYVMRSAYTVTARQPEHLKTILTDERWKESPSDVSVWTDDYTNIMEVFDWN